MRFVNGPLVDHHCHGIVAGDLDRAAFEGLLNESSGPSPLATTAFDSMVGLAVRRWCAPLLGLEPLASAEEYVRRRNDLGAAAVNPLLMAASGIGDLLVDTGLVPETLTTPQELGEHAGARAHEVIRLERVAEQLLESSVPPRDVGEQLRSRLSSSGAVGAKSIAAYRVGLALPASKPTEDALASALAQVRPSPGGSYRIAHPTVHAYLAWTALELGMPLQFHVGYGDSDLNLGDCDPLLLTPFLRATQERGVPVLLLHNYPFHRHASYLAQVFDHVFMDVGLAVHNTGALSTAVVRESLELVPFGKMLFSSDAFGLAELYYLGTILFRRALSGVLESLVDDGDMTEADAGRVATLISRDNARRAYRLP